MCGDLLHEALRRLIGIRHGAVVDVVSMWDLRDGVGVMQPKADCGDGVTSVVMLKVLV